MSEINDTATVEQETTTGETEGANSSESTPNDNSELLNKLNEFGEKLNSLEGRLNRTTKKKTGESETPEKTNNDSDSKYDSLLMKVEGLTKDSEQELAKKLQKETGLPMEKLLGSKYFKSELEDLRTSEANAEASTGVKGDKSVGGNAKETAAYWIAKGEYPTREQVSDPKVRTEIRRAMVAKEKGSSGKFYNS